METQKSIKDAVELCALLDKIEAQIYSKYSVNAVLCA